MCVSARADFDNTWGQGVVRYATLRTVEEGHWSYLGDGCLCRNKDGSRCAMSNGIAQEESVECFATLNAKTPAQERSPHEYAAASWTGECDYIIAGEIKSITCAIQG
jgi:hypothetical protein